MRGRKPKPTERRRLDGNPGRRPLNRDEPTPPPLADLDEPAELVTRPRAIAEWRRVLPMLRACKQITEADRSALLALCLEWDRYLEAAEHATPRIVMGKPTAWLLIQRQALANCLKLWPELGLTPSSRTRIKTADGPGPGGDSFSEFDRETTTH